MAAIPGSPSGRPDRPPGPDCSTKTPQEPERSRRASARLPRTSGRTAARAQAPRKSAVSSTRPSGTWRSAAPSARSSPETTSADKEGERGREDEREEPGRTDRDRDRVRRVVPREERPEADVERRESRGPRRGRPRARRRRPRGDGFRTALLAPTRTSAARAAGTTRTAVRTRRCRRGREGKRPEDERGASVEETAGMPNRSESAATRKSASPVSSPARTSRVEASPAGRSGG